MFKPNQLSFDFFSAISRITGATSPLLQPLQPRCRSSGEDEIGMWCT